MTRILIKWHKMKSPSYLLVLISHLYIQRPLPLHPQLLRLLAPLLSPLPSSLGVVSSIRGILTAASLGSDMELVSPSPREVLEAPLDPRVITPRVGELVSDDSWRMSKISPRVIVFSWWV